MDFIVSKVAMSVCALMVAALLAGAFSSDRLYDRSSEVELVLREFCGTADGALKTGKECTVGWQVPFASSGDAITISVRHNRVSASADDELAILEPLSPIRTWEPVTRQVNLTTLDELDNQAPEASFRSGETVELSTILMTIEDKTALMVFCSRRC